MWTRRALLLSIAAATVWCAEPGVPGVPNFQPVDDRLYRGGQPTEAGLRNLQKRGVKTVLDLRGGQDRAERGWVESLGMRYVHVPMPGLAAPSDDEVAAALALLDPAASSGWPVFVHCRRGKDRTGVVVACYRIAHDGWDNRKALEEARLHGLSRVERAMQQYVLSFIPSKKTP